MYSKLRADPKIKFSRIGMIVGRLIDVCIGLQDLNLPALLVLGIIDKLIINEIKMLDKWRIIVKIKDVYQKKMDLI